MVVVVVVFVVVFWLVCWFAFCCLFVCLFVCLWILFCGFVVVFAVSDSCYSVERIRLDKFPFSFLPSLTLFPRPFVITASAG